MRYAARHRRYESAALRVVGHRGNAPKILGGDGGIERGQVQDARRLCTGYPQYAARHQLSGQGLCASTADLPQARVASERCRPLG